MNYCTDIVSIVNVDVVLYNCIMYCVVLELQFLDALASLKPCWTMFNGHSLMFSRFCHLLCDLPSDCLSATQNNIKARTKTKTIVHY